MSLVNLSNAYTDMQIRLAFARTRIEDLEWQVERLRAEVQSLRLEAPTPSASRRSRLVDTGFDDDDRPY